MREAIFWRRISHKQSVEPFDVTNWFNHSIWFVDNQFSNAFMVVGIENNGDIVLF